MSNSAPVESSSYLPASALESDFPIVEISKLAEQESWRKEINRPLYHIHKWWATRLGSVFRGITLGALSQPGTNIWEQFYRLHDLEGKVVLDPFMGSGTTLGEAVKLGAKAVGCDINPVSTFLVRQAFTRVSENRLRAALDVLEKTVAPKIQSFFQTRDPATGENISVLYYFWVKVVTTPEGEVIPLLSKYVFSQNAYPAKKPRAQILCPACWKVSEGRYDATEFSCQLCSHTFNPQQGPASGQYVTGSNGVKYRIKDLASKAQVPPKHRMYAILARRADGSKIYLSVQAEDERLYATSERMLNEVDLPLPHSRVRPGHNTDQARSYNYTHWRDFFNSRQLLCLGLLLKEILAIEDEAVQEQMLCLFSSTLEFNNLFCSFKGEGTGAVRHMFSNHILKPERVPLENSIWGTERSSGTFRSLFETRLVRAKRYLDEPFELATDFGISNGTGKSRKILSSDPIHATRFESWADLASAEHGILILNGDSSRLAIPDGTVDAVITDPPYFDFVHYSELSDFFYAWLGPALSSRYSWMRKEDSSDAGEVQQKDPRAFSRQLSSVLSEARRVLKHEGVLAFSFHHSKPEGWAAIYEAISSAGLAVVAAHPVHAELRAASPKSAAKDPISLDMILVCRKKEADAFDQSSDQKIAVMLTAADRLQAAGMRMSAGDHFVIAAGMTLIEHAHTGKTFEEIKDVLEEAKSLVRRIGQPSPVESLS